jgi:hypothetical protein
MTIDAEKIKKAHSKLNTRMLYVALRV